MERPPCTLLRYGHIETVRVLVKELDADVNAKDRKGNTPFDLLRNKAHQEELRALLRP